MAVHVPELKDHQDATIRLCKENNAYVYHCQCRRRSHYTDELYAIQDGKYVPLTTKENIEAVSCNSISRNYHHGFEIDTMIRNICD